MGTLGTRGPRRVGALSLSCPNPPQASGTQGIPWGREGMKNVSCLIPENIVPPFNYFLLLSQSFLV